MKGQTLGEHSFSGKNIVLSRMLNCKDASNWNNAFVWYGRTIQQMYLS